MKKFLILIQIAAVLVSCSDFLNTTPPSEFTDQDLGISSSEDDGTPEYTTAEDAENLLKALYQDFRSEYFQLDRFVFNEVLSGNCYVGGSGASEVQIENFTIDANNTIVSRDWSYLYDLITKANRVLNNVPLITDPALSDERKDEIIGEAAFMRAWGYFDLVRFFGDVPLVLEELPAINADNIDELYPQIYPYRAPAENVYRQIISDLQESMSKARTSSPSDKNIVTKGTAEALLAKVYATQPDPDWGEIDRMCDNILAEYPLLDDFPSLFDDQHKNSSEAIFEIAYDGDKAGGTQNWSGWIFVGFDWKRYNVPSVSLVSDFKTNPEDTRINASILFYDATGLWGDRYWEDHMTEFPFSYKIKDYTIGVSNSILLRSADLLLLKAEAKVALGSPDEAWDLVNRLRIRAGIPLLPEADKNDPDKMIDHIIHERRLEFAFEGHFWFDLVRMGKAVEYVSDIEDGKGNKIYAGKINENRLLLPIPQSERSLNGNLTQNPGY